MIKSEAGMVTIKGTNFDIIFEFHQLVHELAEVNPTLLAVILFKDEHIIADAIEKIDAAEAGLIESTIDMIENTRKEMES